MTIVSRSDWLKKYRGDKCPKHGFYIDKSLVKYTGYCKVCDKFWRFIRYIEMKKMPYYWFYFVPKEK